MNQTAAIFSGHLFAQVELPDRHLEVMPGVAWGGIDEFPSPAYWVYQVLARRLTGTTIRHRLGETLAQEIAACLLGGHGIPAKVGIAAFRAVRAARLLDGTPSESELREVLTQQLNVEGRAVRYRFAAQKAKYLSLCLEALSAASAPTQTGRELRDWLLALPGIGHKTASWIARNWLDADDIAILDIHILRAGALGGFLDRTLTVERNYLQLEEQFIHFSRSIQVRASELDSVIWTEMAMSPLTVTRLLNGSRSGVMTSEPRSRRGARLDRTHKSSTDAHQAPLVLK